MLDLGDWTMSVYDLKTDHTESPRTYKTKTENVSPCTHLNMFKSVETWA